MNVFVRLNIKKGILKNVGNRAVLGHHWFHSVFFLLWKSIVTQNCLVTIFFQNISFLGELSLLRHNPEIILICWFAVQETFLMNMSAAISPTLQPKTVCPLKLSKVEPSQYLDGRPPGKTRLLLEEVLVRPAGGAHPAVCVGPYAPV